MFICEACYYKNNNGFWFPISFGPCEVCKKPSECADR